MTVEVVEAIVLSGGSTYGLDAGGGVQAWLREQGYGQRFGPALIAKAPQAIVFDLANGGDKDWGRYTPYRDMGYAAAAAASDGPFALGTAGAGYGATTANLKGGLGSASVVTPRGFTVGAIAAVNAVGTATIGDGPHFWAAPYEIGGEYGGRGLPAALPADALRLRIKGGAPPSTTIALVATDAKLDKAQAKRLAIAAHDGLARALRPAHAPMDGDSVFAAATGAKPLQVPILDLTEIGHAAADCLARAIARGVYEATALPFAGALPSWKDRFG
jgi:L-aminopeptidase/D-esterase-like protein